MPGWDTVPANFRRLDTRVNAADSFANVRDLTVACQNHDKILAERSKHCILSSMFKSIDGQHLSFGHPASDAVGELLLCCPIMLSDQTRELDLIMYARKSSIVDTADSVVVYPVVWDPWGQYEIDENVSITVNNAATTKFTVVVPVPQMRPKARKFAMFGLFVEGGMDGVDLQKAAGGGTLYDAGPGYAHGNYGNDPVGGVVYFTTDTTIEPRRCVRSVKGSVGGDDYYAYIDRAWNLEPVPGTDLVAFRYGRSIEVSSVVLCEKNVTNFMTSTTAGGWL